MDRVHKLLLGLFFILNLIGTSVSSQSNDMSKDLKDASGYLSSNQYQSALDIYQKIVGEGKISPELFSNMAFAYAKLDNYPYAILYYEKALKYYPNDKSLQADLTSIRKKMPQLNDPPKSFILVRWWNYGTGFFSPDFFAWSSILLLTLIGIFVIWMLPHKPWNLNHYLIVTLLAIGFLKQVTAGYTRSQEIYRNDHIIVVQDGLTLKTAADKESPDVEVIPAGSKMQILDRIGDWVQVKNELGDTGWISNDGYKAI